MRRLSKNYLLYTTVSVDNITNYPATSMPGAVITIKI
jgi:hypothetical protein